MERNRVLESWVCSLLFAAVACAPGLIGPIMAQPPSYVGFRTPQICTPDLSCDGTDANLEACVTACLRRAAVSTPEPLLVYLPPRYGVGGGGAVVPYVLDNSDPFVIRRPFYLHGASASSTVIEAQDNTKPLFRIPAASHVDTVNFTGISLSALNLGAKGPCCSGPDPETDPCCRPNNPNKDCPRYQPDTTAVLAINTGPTTTVEFSDIRLNRSRVEIKGAGSFRFQDVNATASGHVDTPILIDHANADVTIVGGHFTGGPDQTLPWPDDVPGPLYHVWQRQGRLQIYGMLPTEAFGNADFRIESAADEPHIIAGVRSEGVRRQEVPYRSALVYVPPTSEAVDIALKGNPARG